MAVLDFNFRPARRDLQLFFGLWLPLFLVAVGAWIAWKHGAVGTGSAILWGIAAGSAAVGWLKPNALWPVFVLWLCLAFPIGWVISHLVLGFVYFGLMTPIGWIMRLLGYDPMARGFNRAASTYWIKHEHRADVKGYFRPV